MAQQVVRRSALIDAATIKIAAIIYMPEMRQRVSQRHHAAEVGDVFIRDYLALSAAAEDRTLGGLCDWVEAEAPWPVDLPVEGAASLKAAAIPVVLHYSTADQLVRPRQSEENTMARAQGARALMALAFETTYGTALASGFIQWRQPNASRKQDEIFSRMKWPGYICSRSCRA